MIEPVKIALAQASPAFFNKDETLQKIHDIARETGRHNARLVVFPEAFLPGYPRGFNFGVHVGNRTDEGRELWQRYHDQSFDMDGPEMAQMADTARQANIFISAGVVEKDGGTLYCTNLFFGPDGTFLGKHRKLKPTAAERYIWGEGDGHTLTTIHTDIGVIGSLICWENYMPLARMAMYNQGVQIYIAPTADHRESWQSTIRHIALEGRCFVLSCNQYVNKGSIPPDLIEFEKNGDPERFTCRGGSAVVAPNGDILAGPLWDDEGILYADLDPGLLTRSKFDLDVRGHYSRPDVFKFEVIGQPPVLRISTRSSNSKGNKKNLP
jgi:nitrilase